MRQPIHIAGDRVGAGPAAGAAQIDLEGHLVFPGLVNAHDHLQLNNVPPLPGGGAFQSSYAWIAAMEPHLKTAATEAAAAVPAGVRCWQGGLKNLLAGTTTVAHHDPWYPVFDDAGFPVHVLKSYGWCHSLGLAPPATGSPGLGRRLAARMLGPRAPRALGPYGPGVTDSFSSTPRDRPWIIHLAEGRDEVAARELGELARLGCLADNTVIVHGVGLQRQDLRAIIDRGAAVVWCPSSNLSVLGATIAPRALFEAGRLALGSDSRLSGGRDLLDELRVAAAQEALSPAELFRLVTTDGGRILRCPEVGGLAPGQRADLLVVADDGGDPHRRLLALERGDIRAVVRGGLPAIADPDLAEWFGRLEIESRSATLDGRAKLLAKAIANAEAIRFEPGLELVS